MQTKQISRQFKTLYKDLHSCLELLHTNNVLKPEFESFLIEPITARLKCSAVPVQQSLAHIGLYSDEINNDRLKYNLLLDALWRMIANKESLAKGTAILPYRHFTIPEKVEVFFRYVEDIVDTAYKKRLTMKVLTGHYAMGDIVVSLNEGAIFHILKHIGYSGSNKYPLPVYPLELCGLIGKLDIDVVSGSVRIKDVVDDNSIVQYNRDTSINFRLGNKLCPDEAGKFCINCNKVYCRCHASYKSGLFMWNVDINDPDLHFIL